MKVTIIRVFSTALVLLLVGACSTTTTTNKQQAAKKALASKGISYYETAFISAAKYGKTDVVKEFLTAGMDVNANVDGTALIASTASKNLDMVKFLLANGADVNETNYLGSALSAAVYVGSFDIVKYLIESGADVNLASDDGTTPIIIAAQTKQGEMIEILAKAGGNVNYIFPVTGLSPLIFAASKGAASSVEQLIKNGANVNYKDYSGTSVLAWALLGNYKDIAKNLIENGANPKAHQVMIAALCHSDTDFVPYLIKHGVDVNGLAFGKMPFIVWCAKNGLTKGVEILVNNGANIKATDENGTSALDFALSRKDYKVVKLLDPSIDINSLPKKKGDPNLISSSLQYVNDAKVGDNNAYGGSGTGGIDSLQPSKGAFGETIVPKSTKSNDANAGTDSGTDGIDSMQQPSGTSKTADVVVPGEKQSTSVYGYGAVTGAADGVGVGVDSGAPLSADQLLTQSPNADVVVPGEAQDTSVVDVNKRVDAIKKHFSGEAASAKDDSADDNVVVVPGQSQETEVTPGTKDPLSSPSYEQKKTPETFDPTAK